jgi:hypothetical protein
VKIARAIRGKEAILLESVVRSHPLEFEILLKVLERRGLVPKAEVLGEIKQPGLHIDELNA